MGNYRNRRTIFTWLRKQKPDVVFLQETHSTEGNEVSWQREWGWCTIYQVTGDVTHYQVTCDVTPRPRQFCWSGGSMDRWFGGSVDR